MDSSLMTYAALAVAALAVIAAFFALRNINNANRQRPAITGSDQSEHLQVKSPARPRNNHKHLTSLQHQLRRIPPLFAGMSENILYNGCAGFLTPYVDARKAIDAKSEPSREEQLAYYESILNLQGLSAIRPRLDEASKAIASLVVDGYSEVVKSTFDTLPDAAEQRSRYVLTVDLATEQKRKIASNVLKSFDSITHHLQRSLDLRPSLASEFAKIREELSESFDLRGFVRGFGLGAMAVASPWVGVPAVIGNFLNDQKNEKQKEEYLEGYFSRLSEYDEELHNTITSFNASVEEAHKYVKVKSEEIFCAAIMQMLTELHQQGFDLAKVERAQEFHELDDLEKQLAAT